MQRNQTTYVILGILAIHPHQSGYEIRKTIQQSVGFFWGESFGQIYPTLKRLLAEKLIVPSNSGAAARANRKEYSITPAGHECLQQWLAAPYRDDPPRNEFLLKIFFARDAGPGVALAHVRRFRENHQRILTTLEQLEPLARAHNSQNPGFPYWMLTLSLGVAQLRAAVEWSESALAMLSASEAGPTSNPQSQGTLSNNNP
ncbi:MAG: PadR family transcriptional regulator [Terracidiphilus sp.]|jgi:PadR family transcriptional regulator, regulatory protein AphA